MVWIVGTACYAPPSLPLITTVPIEPKPSPPAPMKKSR